VSPEFLGLIRQFAASPATYLQAGLEQLAQDIEDKLWDLQFFKAGRVLGNLTAAVLRIAPALQKLPALLRSIQKVTERLVKLSIAEIKKLGLSLERLTAFAQGPFTQLATPEGFILATIDNDILILDRTGTPLGKLSRSEALQQLGGGQAASSAFLVEGFLSLTSAARSWLAQNDNFLGLARRFLSSDVENVKEIVDAINQFHRCKNFERVVGNYLRGLSTTGKWAEPSKKGASFVLRYANAELKGIDPFLIDFESRVLAGGPIRRGEDLNRSVFVRFADIAIANKRIELKSVTDLSEKAMKGAIKQLGRDIVANSDDLSRIKWVFDAKTLKVAPSTLLKDIQSAIKSNNVLFRSKPWNDILDMALEKIITFWP
jgi:hypothetical protein